MAGTDDGRCAAVEVLLPCGMDATLWTIGIARCDALDSSGDGVDGAADDAVCPCASPASETSASPEVRTVAALP